MLGLSTGLERRDPGHGLDQHAGRAHLRARAGDRLRAGARRPAGRNAHPSRLCVGARPQLGRQGRAARRLRPRQSAPRSVRRRNTPCAPTRWPRWSRRISRNGDLPCAIVATVGTTATTAIDPIAAIAEIAAAPWDLAACRRRDGGQRDDPARMPLDVGGRRGRGLAGDQRAQMARRAVRLLALLRPRSRASDARDVAPTRASCNPRSTARSRTCATGASRSAAASGR